VQPGVAGVGIVQGAGIYAGQRVLVGAVDPCGECDVCRRGGASVCPNARRRAMTADERTVRAAPRWLVALGDGLDIHGPEAAAVAGDVAIAYTLYARANVAPRDALVVTGATPIARFLVDILVAKDAAPVVVVADDAPATWREHLARRGLAIAGDTRDAVVAAMTAREAHRTAASRPWRVLATAREPSAAALCGPRATLAVYTGGVAHAGWADALAGALAREVAITGVAAPHPELVLETAAMVAKGEIELAVARDTCDPTRSRIALT
jgi:6-hydroxycyclohex-1-ene-1-carbonyl-CoA dehydrogenase